MHWTFAPMVDIARDARWGRIVEGAGEDPYLGSVMAAARVRGFQGDDLASPATLLATAKHFVAYGAAEGGRDYNMADVSERTLREVYLPPFKAAVRAGAGSFMAAFNEIGGMPAHASDWLLSDVLRERWGFGGLVVSDWTGVLELIRTASPPTARRRRRWRSAPAWTSRCRAPCTSTWPPAVRAGAFPQATIDSAVRRVLRAK